MRVFPLAVCLALWAGLAQAHYVTIASWPGQERAQTSLIRVLARISENDGMLASVRRMTTARDAVSMVALAGLEFTVTGLAEAQDAYHGRGAFEGRPAPDLRLIAVIGELAVLGSDAIRFDMDHHLALLIHEALGRTGHVPAQMQGLAPADLVPRDTGIPYARGAARYWREAGLLD